jgi:hypothetical protein
MRRASHAARRKLRPVTSRARLGLVSLVGLASLAVTSLADAASLRPRFEPTDLELEKPGIVEIDMQVGLTSGDASTGRLYLPDWEIDVGLLPRLELDIDGAFALEPLRYGTAGPAFGEPLWASFKIGLVDLKDVGPARAAALGLQIGPRLPVGAGLRGTGYEALVLAGVDLGAAHLVFNAGGLVDPASTTSLTHATAALAGVDVELDLWGASSPWSVLVEAGGAHYFSNFAALPDQLAFTAGLAYDAGWAQWSIVSLVAPVGVSDRAGVLLGFSPRIGPF